MHEGHALPPPPAPAPVAQAPVTGGPAKVVESKVTERAEDTGAGEPANAEVAKKISRGRAAKKRVEAGSVPEETGLAAPGAAEPTESRPARKPRAKGAAKPSDAPEGS